MRPNGYSTRLLAIAGATILLSASAQAQYGTGASLDVPHVSPGAITLDGQADEAAWAGAPEIDLTANWDGAWSGHPDPDVAVMGRVLWSEGVLYVYVSHEDYQDFFWGTEGNAWGGEQILVGVDLTHAGDDQTDPDFGGWVANAPNLGPVTYKITGAPEYEGNGITLGWDETAVDPSWAAGEVFVDDATFTWGVEMAIYGAEIEPGAQIGFNLGGASADAATADGGDDGAYAYYAWQNCDSEAEGRFCYPGGGVMADAGTFATLSLVASTASEGTIQTDGFTLRPNYPNPFHGTTTVAYAMDRPGDVELAVYDVLGRRVTLLASGARSAGEHSTALDASALPSGVYVVRLAVDGAVVATGRMMKVK